MNECVYTSTSVSTTTKHCSRSHRSLLPFLNSGAAEAPYPPQQLLSLSEASCRLPVSLFLCYFSSSFSLFLPSLTMESPCSPSRSSSPAILIIPWPLPFENPALPFCHWNAVSCSRRHPTRVVALHLNGMDLRGTISPSLGNLSFLRSLDLSVNALHGHIPHQLGRLFRLRTLWLNDNQFEANIPHQLASCRNLVSLALSFNHLSGNIPGELSSLKHLRYLYLGANSLTEYGLGDVVSTKGDVYSYGILLLEMFTGKIPTSDIFAGNLNLHKWVNMAFPNKVNEVIHNNLFRELDRDEYQKYTMQECLHSLLWVGLLCSKDSPNERPTMREVVTVLENLKEDLVANTIASRRLRRSISNLLGNTNALKKDSHASNNQSCSTF